ncbi:NAD(P)H-dependent FMN reductase [Diaminobutyricimonas aerilata]|uniref:NAD(P)H-dependent FMN reductase n=1 Tax=Diaminobutyricimonas aerilata TaxID=1162967 RepID=A0A2M9CLS2_9MICO|nr:NAD(P)H-dependent oxidoreductase [Diaminobutyricimonas aerilata]PJJ72855.1 NAD(P)H-dependent FMN reductase [Diaminobutyricimonas aerilata]
MTRLMIIVGSVREGRVGLPVAQWVRAEVERHGGFEVDFVDLAELALPLMDEPNHPAKHEYTRPYTMAWSERVTAADAFVFVTPEYNHSLSPALKNAVDYLFREWGRKPVGFVSYGGVSGGSRSVAAFEPVLTTLGLVKTGSNVEIPFVGGRLVDGAFAAEDRERGLLNRMLDELGPLSEALRPLR